MPSDSDEHEVIKALYVTSRKARKTTVKKRKYNSLDTHTRLETLFSERSGYKLYEWQIDIAEALFSYCVSTVSLLRELVLAKLSLL